MSTWSRNAASDLEGALTFQVSWGLFKILPKISCLPKLLSLNASLHNEWYAGQFGGISSEPFRIPISIKNGCLPIPLSPIPSSSALSKAASFLLHILRFSLLYSWNKFLRGSISTPGQTAGFHSCPKNDTWKYRDMLFAHNSVLMTVDTYSASGTPVTNGPLPYVLYLTLISLKKTTVSRQNTDALQLTSLWWIFTLIINISQLRFDFV